MKVVSFFDYVDREEDEKRIRRIIEDIPDINYVGTENEDEFESALTSNCVALIDYGGIGFGLGGSGLQEHYDRWIEEKIRENPSIAFVFLLTFGEEYYPDLWDLPNVHKVQRGIGERESLLKLLEELRTEA